ncbi:RHS repeat protein [Pseudomonas viridiflava]|uniref:RHS repeat protein n=1 Tax=Pseudomonas viridiflava TaxID=33069 RepID=UPI000F0645A8|nr:RHS repeat protein [Pseudomonas viridiflava]
MTFSPMMGTYSDARNQLSFIESGVDPRTGTYSCRIPFPELNANNLMGPVIRLGIHYDPLAGGEDIGFGINWDLPLTQFDTQAGLLKLSTGETFQARSTGTSLQLLRNKLADFRGEVSNAHKTIRIIHKTGIIETLTEIKSDLWVVSRINSPEGREVSVNCQVLYGKVRLNEIRDENGRLMATEWKGRTGYSIVFWPDDPAKKLIYDLDNNGWLRAVSIRTEANRGIKPIASWRFTYEAISHHAVLTVVRLPTGATEQINYRRNGLSLPQGAPIATVPAVESYLILPGLSQPTIRREYHYSSNNYLGGGGVTWAPGRDNLYSTHANYEYDTTEIMTRGSGAGRSIKRTYNRFHLLIKEVTTQSGKTNEREIQYPVLKDVQFSGQPRNFQLPTQVDTTYFDTAKPTEKRKETTLTEYDLNGNLLKQVSASGVTETFEYYPITSSDGCPADFVRIERWLKQKTVSPAPGDGTEPTLITRYRYVTEPNVRRRPARFHVLDQESTYVGTERNSRMTVNFKYEANFNAFAGRLSERVERVGGVPNTTTYTYAIEDNILISTTTVKGKGEASSESVSWQDIVSGNEVRSVDSLGVVTTRTFDQLGRITQETVSPETPQEATRGYSYKLHDIHLDPVERTVTHANGARSETQMDGLGREVRVQRQDMDADKQPMRVVYNAKYDSFGQLVEETHTDWLDGKAYPLVTRHTYDDWGQRMATTGPDNVTRYAQQDPVSLKHSEWREGSGKIVTTKNLFAKDSQVERFDRHGESHGVTSYTYDGLGRCTEKNDAVGLVTTFSYDFAGRLSSTTLPDGTVVEKEYVEHSLDDLATQIWVNDYMAGEREYDGLLRVTSLTVGGRTETFSYEGAQTWPASHTKASGKVIEYKYEPALDNQLVKREVSGSAIPASRFQYDNVHAGLVQASSGSSQQSQEYFSSGQLKDNNVHQSGVQAGGHYRHSLNGLELEYETTDGFTKTISYDSALRIRDVVRNPMKVDYQYDRHGRVSRISARESVGQQIVTSQLEYDDFDREIKRRITVFTNGWRELTQTYSPVDKLLERVLSNEQGLLLKETFEYDPRGRLWGYECSGPRAPVDAAGKTITSQLYFYNELDNITRVRTVFASGRSGFNDARYHYLNEDETQLTRVSNTHPDYASQNADFTYDADGNQLNDDRGRKMIYDELGRLTTVTGA